MAIQLNERDYLIFKLLAEHNILLEKHIAWFIAAEDKPVLIRDRLRKLFYLDYILCQRYDNKLPWWTTPTKPLIYMLAPLAKTITGSKTEESETMDSEQQQRCLEIANIRMIFLMAQNEGLLHDLQWKSCWQASDNSSLLDATISCSDAYSAHRIGLLGQPTISGDLPARIGQELNKQNLSSVMIVTRDEEHQENLKKLWCDNKSQESTDKVIFVVHQDLYKGGLGKADIFKKAMAVPPLAAGQNPIFTDMHAA